MRNFLAQNAWPPWPADGATEASCGCGLVSREVLNSGYVWYRSMQWCLREWLNHQAGSAPLSSTGFRWPTAFMFHVDAATVRRRSRGFYRALHRAASEGVRVGSRRVDPYVENKARAAQAAELAEADRSLGQPVA